MQLSHALIWIAFIVCLFLVWFFSHRANHKEKMMMMEKGIDLADNARKNSGLQFPWLKIGIVIIGLSCGVLLIGLLAAIKLVDSNAVPIAVLGLSGGIAMVIANNVKNGKSKE